MKADDVINRQAAINVAVDAVDDWAGRCNKTREEYIRKALETIPPANVPDNNVGEMDCISRELALEKMADYVASGYADSAKDFEEYSKIICQLPPVTPAEGSSEWIPVSERLPEDKQAVLVWCPQYKNIYCAYLEKEQWWIFGAFVQIVPNAVVAWRHLPEPYKASPTGAEGSRNERPV